MCHSNQLIYLCRHMTHTSIDTHTPHIVECRVLANPTNENKCDGKKCRENDYECDLNIPLIHWTHFKTFIHSVWIDRMSKFFSLLFLANAGDGDAVQGSYCYHTQKENEHKHAHAHTETYTRDEWRKSGNNNEMKPPEAIEMIERKEFTCNCLRQFNTGACRLSIALSSLIYLVHGIKVRLL